jgi:hypothetical protein
MNEPIIPDIATKIRDLSATKHVYLKLIMQMYPLLNDPLLKRYVCPLIRLLQSIINISKLDVLLELEDTLSSVLVTYICDINELIKGQLDIKKYEPRHTNLIAIIRQIDYYLHYDVQYNDRKDLEQLKTNLFLI